MAAAPVWRLSGGAANADPTVSLGGVLSSVALPTNLFDNIAADESAIGDIEYRGVYVYNNGASSMTNSRVWIQSNTPYFFTDVAVALAVEGLNATMATIANEGAAPATVVFTSPVDFATGLIIGTLAASQRYGIWVRRTIGGGAGAYSGDTFTLRVQGDN